MKKNVQILIIIFLLPFLSNAQHFDPPQKNPFRGSNLRARNDCPPLAISSSPCTLGIVSHPRLLLAAGWFILASPAPAFGGRITAAAHPRPKSSQRTAALHGRHQHAANRSDRRFREPANPVDVLDRNSGELTLLFPHNRSFVKLRRPC